MKTEADVQFELCFRLRESGVPFAQEYVAHVAGATRNARFDIVVLRDTDVIGIIEVKKQARKKLNSNPQLDRYGAFGLPLFFCDGADRIDDAVSFAITCMKTPTLESKLITGSVRDRKNNPERRKRKKKNRQVVPGWTDAPMREIRKEVVEAGKLVKARLREEKELQERATLSPVGVDDIRKLYDSGLGVKAISKTLGLRRIDVRPLIKKWNVEKKQSKRRPPQPPQPPQLPKKPSEQEIIDAVRRYNERERAKVVSKPPPCEPLPRQLSPATIDKARTLFEAGLSSRDIARSMGSGVSINDIMILARKWKSERIFTWKKG